MKVWTLFTTHYTKKSAIAMISLLKDTTMYIKESRIERRQGTHNWELWIRKS